MGQIIVRNLDDKVINRLKARAKANKRSAEAEVREILSKAVAPARSKQRSLASLIGAGGMTQSQAEIDAYVRALRDEWDH